MPISDDLCNVGCVEKIKFFKEGGAKKGTDLKKKKHVRKYPDPRYPTRCHGHSRKSQTNKDRPRTPFSISGTEAGDGVS